MNIENIKARRFETIQEALALYGSTRLNLPQGGIFGSTMPYNTELGYYPGNMTELVLVEVEEENKTYWSYKELHDL